MEDPIWIKDQKNKEIWFWPVTSSYYVLAFSFNQHNITMLFCPIISLSQNMSADTTFLQTPPAYLTNILLLSIWNPYLSFKLMCQYCRLTFRRADGELEAKLLSVITGLLRFISPRARWKFSFSTVLGKSALRNRWQQNCVLATPWSCQDVGIDFRLLGHLWEVIL